MAVAPFNIAETVPGDSDFVRNFPAAERAFRDIVESYLNTEHDSGTGRHAFPVDTTTNLGGLTYPANGTFRYDTTLDVLQFRVGSAWEVISIQNNQQMLIRNADGNAPPGWTKNTLGATHYSIVASDSGISLDGGSSNFEDVFQARTITQANLPNVNFTVSGTAASDGAHTHTFTTDSGGDHTHSVRFAASDVGSGFLVPNGGWENGVDTDATISTTSNGAHTHTGTTNSGGAHTHSVSGTAASGGSGTSLDFNVARLGFILCIKAGPA